VNTDIAFHYIYLN